MKANIFQRELKDLRPQQQQQFGDRRESQYRTQGRIRKIEERVCKKIKIDYEYRAECRKQNASNWITGDTSIEIQFWNN
jgi:hypothetical protein